MFNSVEKWQIIYVYFFPISLFMGMWTVFVLYHIGTYRILHAGYVISYNSIKQSQEVLIFLF